MSKNANDERGDGTDAETTEGPTTDREDQADDRECLIVEIRVPTDALPLGETLARLDIHVEFEQIVPSVERPLPYLWTSDGNLEAFEEAVSTDSTVESARRVAALNDGGLYELEWTDPKTPLLEWFDGGNGTILQLDGEVDEWHLKLRVESRDALGSLQNHCNERDIEFELVRLYRFTQPKMGQFNVSEKQFEALMTALEMGYFEIPRDTTLGDLADALGISKRAASERLRRGQTNLVYNTLVVGRPSAIGLD